MGKQINFWQTEKDEHVFVEFINSIGLRIYRKGKEINDIHSIFKLPIVESQCMLSLTELGEVSPYDDSRTRYFHATDYPVVEFDVCINYLADKHYIDLGRLWIDSRLQEYPLYSKYKILVGWIKKNYKKIKSLYIRTGYASRIAVR